jgi:hypothetical protein
MKVAAVMLRPAAGLCLFAALLTGGSAAAVTAASRAPAPSRAPALARAVAHARTTAARVVAVRRPGSVLRREH